MTVDQLLDAAITCLSRPLDVLARAWPQFTPAELAEMQRYLPRYRRARMAGR